MQPQLPCEWRERQSGLIRLLFFIQDKPVVAVKRWRYTGKKRAARRARRRGLNAYLYMSSRSTRHFLSTSCVDQRMSYWFWAAKRGRRSPWDVSHIKVFRGACSCEDIKKRFISQGEKSPNRGSWCGGKLLVVVFRVKSSLWQSDSAILHNELDRLS